jgi:hypothetical protein
MEEGTRRRSHAGQRGFVIAFPEFGTAPDEMNGCSLVGLCGEEEDVPEEGTCVALRVTLGIMHYGRLSRGQRLHLNDFKALAVAESIQ